MTFYGSVNERQRKDQFVNDTIWWFPPQRNVKDMSHRSITRINWRMFMKECPWPRIVQCMPNIGEFTLSLTRLRQPCRISQVNCCLIGVLVVFVEMWKKYAVYSTNYSELWMSGMALCRHVKTVIFLLMQGILLNSRWVKVLV